MAQREIQRDSQTTEDDEATARADEEDAVDAEDCVHLDALLEEDDDVVTLAETITDPSLLRPDDLVGAVQHSKLLGDLVGRLAPQAQQVLFLRYGFVEDRSHSVVEIARMLGTFPTCVEGTERRALSLLRRWCRAGAFLPDRVASGSWHESTSSDRQL